MGDELGVTPNKGDEVDPAGITAYRDMTSLQPARQLIFFVRQRYPDLTKTFLSQSYKVRADRGAIQASACFTISASPR